MRRSQQLNYKNNRASYLKHLHLKKRFHENPALTRFPKEFLAALRAKQQQPPRRSLDVSGPPTAETSQMRVRVRNRRGEYQEVSPDSRSQGSSGLVQAEERLMVIEQLAKFKEERVQREFEKLNGELMKEAEREYQERLKEQKRLFRMER